jgi:hypothetical protein
VTEATTAAPEQVEGQPPANLGEFEKMAWVRLNDTIKLHNAEVQKLKAVAGDPQGLIEALRVTDSDDPNIKAAQDLVTQYDKALNDAIVALDELLKPQAEKMQAEVKEQVESITSKVDEYTKTIKAGQNYLKGLAGDDALKGLTPVEKLKTGGTTGGSGQTRVRGFDFFVDGKLATVRDAQGKERSNLAAAAKLIGVDTNALKGAFYQAQETQDSTKFKDEVKFGVKHDDKVYEVYCRRQVDEEAAPSGPEQPETPAA